MKAIILDGETADRLAADTIKQHISFVRGNIKRLKAQRKTLTNAQREDLITDECLLDSMIDVYRYFAGNK